MSRRSCDWRPATEPAHSERPVTDSGCSRVTVRRWAHPIFAPRLRRSESSLPSLGSGSRLTRRTPRRCSGGLSACAGARCGWCRRSHRLIPSSGSTRSTCGASTRRLGARPRPDELRRHCVLDRRNWRSRSAGAHVTPPGRAAALIDEPSHGQLAAALGDAVLLELIELDGTLTALTLSGGRPGPPSARTDGGDQGAAGLVALRAHAPGRVAAYARTARRDRGRRAGLGTRARPVVARTAQPKQSGNGPVVLVPTGALHAVPWAMLPSMRGRPLVVAPSAATWLGLQTRTRDARGQGSSCRRPAPASLGR